MLGKYEAANWCIDSTPPVIPASYLWCHRLGQVSNSRVLYVHTPDGEKLGNFDLVTALKYLS